MADQPPRSPRPFSRALLIAVMVTVLYGAILVAVYGFISLFSDRDVISEPDAGPLIGPVMAVTALLIMFFSVLGGLSPEATRRQGSARYKVPVGRAIGTATSIYLLGPAAGSIVYAFGHEQLLTAVLFFAEYLASPFVISSAIVALVLILLLPLIDLAGSATR